MKSKLLKIAFASISKNKLNSFFMMLGIIIGITALTIIISTGFGSREVMIERLEKFGSDTVSLFPGSGGRNTRLQTGEIVNPITVDYIEAIRQNVPNVTVIGPFAARREMDFKAGNEVFSGGKLFGITPEFSIAWNWEIETGDFISDSDMENASMVCVITTDVKDKLFGDSNPVGETLKVKNYQLEIIGVLETKGSSPGGMSSMDDKVLIPMTTFMRKIVNTDEIDQMKIKFSDPALLPVFVEDLTKFMREYRNLEPGQPDDFTIKTTVEVTQQAEEMAGTFNLFLIIITSISLLAGGIVIANIMLISINKRKFEIGLRKSIGANKKDIMWQFLFETVAITFTGGIIGIVLGVTGSILTYTITQLPIVINWETVLIGIVFSSLVGIISGLYPANKAANLMPVETLRS
jgi:putative ABC transport system permease protein